MIKHRHHIVPKHAGGSDNKDNILELTIEEHAQAHKDLWEKYGKKEDWLAWQGLSNMIDRQQIIKEAIRLGSSKAGKIAGPKSVENGRLLEMSKKGIDIFRNKFDTEEAYKEHFRQLSKKQIGIPKDKLKNYMWITNGIENIKVKKDIEIPLGYKRGRTKHWKTGYNNENKPKIECPHCRKQGGAPVMKRYHFDNCKNR